MNIKCVLRFSIVICPKNFSSKKKWARYDKKCIPTFTQTAGYSCQISTNLEFYQEIYEKIKYKISLKSVQWELRCSIRIDRQTDRQT